MSELNNQTDLNKLFGAIESNSATRSIRINGKVTSVRLENFYWRVLTDIAESQNLMLSQLMTELSRMAKNSETEHTNFCLLYTSPSPRDQRGSRMPSSA